jgi:hypothetical protein
MASCAKCGGPFEVTAHTMLCRTCNQVAALRMASCPTCRLEVAYDTTGHLVISHQAGCHTFAEFKAAADELSATRGHPTRGHETTLAHPGATALE